MSTIQLHGNTARFGTAVIEAHHGLVTVSIADESTRIGLRLELAPACALQLAQALQSHAAALLAQSEGSAA